MENALVSLDRIGKISYCLMEIIEIETISNIRTCLQMEKKTTFQFPGKDIANQFVLFD